MFRWLFRSIATVALAGYVASVLPASVARWVYLSPPNDRSVVLETQDASGKIDFCRAVSVPAGIVTVHHCITAAQNYILNHQPISVRFADGRRFPISADAIEARKAQPFAASDESSGLDFAVIKLALPGQPMSLPTDDLASVSVGDTVLLGWDPGMAAKCTILTVCGGELTIKCSPSDRETWSGSGVWKVGGGKRQLVGLVKAGTVASDLNLGPSYSRVTSYVAILGRSSALFPSKESFAGTFARNPKFAYQWKPKAEQCNRVMPGAALNISPLPRHDVMHGVAALSDHLVATVDVTNGEICLADTNSRKNVFCSTNPSRSNDAINAMIPIGKELFALPEAQNPPLHPGGITFARIEAGPHKAIDFKPNGYPYATSAVGSVYTAVRADGDVIGGGQLGVCLVNISTCGIICVNSVKWCSNKWRVNGLLSLPDGGLVAVGQDYLAGRSFPTCAWFKKVAAHWEWQARCNTTGPLTDANAVLEAGGRDMQLKAPVLIGNQVFAFGSDGSAYLLAPDGSTHVVPIQGLDEAKSQVEDAVRTVVPLDGTHVAIGSDDGAVRVLTLVNGVSGPAFIGSRAWTAYDISLWVTELTASNHWIVARGQDGVLTLVTWAGSLP